MLFSRFRNLPGIIFLSEEPNDRTAADIPVSNCWTEKVTHCGDPTLSKVPGRMAAKSRPEKSNAPPTTFAQDPTRCRGAPAKKRMFSVGMSETRASITEAIPGNAWDQMQHCSVFVGTPLTQDGFHFQLGLCVRSCAPVPRKLLTGFPVAMATRLETIPTILFHTSGLSEVLDNEVTDDSVFDDDADLRAGGHLSSTVASGSQRVQKLCSQRFP